MDDDATAAKRVRWILTDDMQRTLRFVGGMIMLIQQTMIATEPNSIAVGVGLLLAGSPFANIADEARKVLAGRNGGADK